MLTIHPGAEENSVKSIYFTEILRITNEQYITDSGII